MIQNTHSFNVRLAQMYGVTESILLTSISYWCDYNMQNERNFHDGRYWSFNSIKSWSRLFPYLSEAKIRRALDGLVKKGALIKGNYNASKYDRTSWYTLSDTICALCQMDLHTDPNQFDVVDEPIPVQTQFKHKEDDVAAWWNGVADKHSLSKIKKLTGTRAKHLNARVKDAGSLSQFKKEIEKALSESTFLCGGDKEWKADLDFFLNESSFAKVSEGKYKTHSDSRISIHRWGVNYTEFEKKCPQYFIDTCKSLNGGDKEKAQISLVEFYQYASKNKIRHHEVEWEQSLINFINKQQGLK